MKVLIFSVYLYFRHDLRSHNGSNEFGRMSSNGCIANVEAEWLAMLLCILQVLGSNLGPQIRYPY
jgi:hypothetical protein